MTFNVTVSEGFIYPQGIYEPLHSHMLITHRTLNSFIFLALPYGLWLFQMAYKIHIYKNNPLPAVSPDFDSCHI